MNQARRPSMPTPASWPLATPDTGYRPGGEVGAMQAELERRLNAAGSLAGIDAEPRRERLLRHVSAGAGYATLAAAVGLLGVAIF